MFSALMVASIVTMPVPQDREVLTVDPDRTISILGEIGGDGALFTARAFDEMSKASTKPIYVVINSFGGGIEAGGIILDSMRTAKKRGVEVVCAVTVAAMSMAMQIFGECSTRYSFPYSLLMWHPGKIFSNAPMTEQALEMYAKDLKIWNDQMNEDLIEALGIDEEVYYYHYHAETVHSGQQLDKLAPDFMDIILDIQGFKGVIYAAPYNEIEL